MVSTYLQGGLANFCFQIVAAYSLAIDNKDEAFFYEDIAHQGHNSINSYKDNIFKKINFKSGNPTPSLIFNEVGFEYNKIPYQPNMFMVGYFQSEKYFKHNRESILDLFSINSEIGHYIDEKYGYLLDSNSCSLHVRRGDYLSLPDYHPVCTMDYYRNAIAEFSDDTRFLVFSDDIQWCKENFKGDNFHFIEGEKDYVDLYLMSLCNNNIIANSSFSWWGAWLNNTPNKKVIAPKQWFGKAKQLNTKDLIPETWIIL